MLTYLDLWTLFGAYGLTFGLMNDKAWWLTDRLRALKIRVQKGDDGKDSTFFDRMFLCPYCTGFHAGWMIWLIRVAEAGRLPVATDGWIGGIVGNVAAVILCAFAASAFCYVVDTAAQWLEAHVQ